MGTYVQFFLQNRNGSIFFFILPEMLFLSIRHQDFFFGKKINSKNIQLFHYAISQLPLST